MKRAGEVQVVLMEEVLAKVEKGPNTSTVGRETLAASKTVLTRHSKQRRGPSTFFVPRFRRHSLRILPRCAFCGHTY